MKQIFLSFLMLMSMISASAAVKIDRIDPTDWHEGCNTATDGLWTQYPRG